MSTAPLNPAQPPVKEDTTPTWQILAPYALAIGAQIPMLLLYFRVLWSRPHYKPFTFAILATIGLALTRWPFGHKQPFHKSLTADIFLFVGLGSAFFGMLFVEPWFAAASVMFLTVSLFARTMDKETFKSLWPCSLPLFVYLMLPFGTDVNLITKLQIYSAQYTSKLLDLIGLGHHMDGTVIKVPGENGGEYGIEEACSGVQSFFTLLLVAVIFVVLSRRIKTPKIGEGVAALLLGLVALILKFTVFTGGVLSDLFLLFSVGAFLHAIIGFRAAALILSAVFWAIFMNTLRIMAIPLAKYLLQIDLSADVPHGILGYVVLTLGILLLFSTDQFFYFLFGPVDTSAEHESGPLGRFIAQFWNRVISGQQEEEESTRKKKRRSTRQTISNPGRILIWSCAAIMVAMGLWQLVDVQRSWSANANLNKRFFDTDTTIDFQGNDLPRDLSDDWTWIKHATEVRSIGSDLGERSDIWRLQSDYVSALFSIDQPFPGWHELTTCYKNVGWKLVDRKAIQPESDNWGYIEAKFEKETGEKAYLLFCHFDAFGEGLDVPSDWGTIQSFMIRAQNRLSHRIRASLFQGEAYQTQLYVTSFNEIDDKMKIQIQKKFLELRNLARQKFLEKKQGNPTASESAGP